MKSRRRGCGTRDSHRLWLNTDCWYGAAPGFLLPPPLPIVSFVACVPSAIRSGLFTGSLTYMIILYCVSTIYAKVFVPWFGATLMGFAARGILITLAVLAALSHLRSRWCLVDRRALARPTHPPLALSFPAMLSNPGTVPSNSRPVDPANWDRACHRCNHFKPPRAHHCSICGRCVIKVRGGDR